MCATVKAINAKQVYQIDVSISGIEFSYFGPSGIVCCQCSSGLRSEMFCYCNPFTITNAEAEPNEKKILFLMYKENE